MSRFWGAGVSGLRPVFMPAAGAVNAFSAPVLSFAVGHVAGTNPPEWDSDITGYISWDAGTSSGDKEAMRWRRVNGGAWTTEVDQPLDDELLTGGFTWPLLEAAKTGGQLAAGYFEAQEQRARFSNGVEVARSDWSVAGVIVDTLAAPIFLPSQVTGIKDYYKVSMARCWKDTAGTIPVTADGDAVARWDSEMAVLSSFTQATLANRPLYRTNSGNPYLDFDGTNDNMVIGSTALATMAQPFYMGFAAKLDAGNYHQLCDGRAGSNRAIIQCASAPPDKWQLQAGTNVADQGLNPTLNDAVIAGLFNGASSQPRLDGTGGTVVSIGAQSPIDGLTIGSNNTVNGGFLDGRIYGFVLVAASPSSGNKASLDTWLGALQGRSI